jgi:hypothetical protein
MKSRILLLALMAMALVVTSCSKDDESSVPSGYVGTWKCNSYCAFYNLDVFYMMYAEDGYPPTTVTLNADGTCSGSGMFINGNGTWEIDRDGIVRDLYEARVIFHQKEKNDTVFLKAEQKDLKTAYVLLPGYPDQWFVFKK